MHIESKIAALTLKFCFVRTSLVLLVLISMLISETAIAADKPVLKSETADNTVDADALRAKEMLDRAVAYYEEKKEHALAAFNRQGEFIQGELYVFAINTTGVMLASGGSSSALIDRIVLGLSDVDGKLIFKEILEIARSKGGGSLEYRWLNRIDHKVERKVTHFKKVGDVIIAVGYYIPRASAEQARKMLNRASIAVKNDPKSAFKEFADLGGKYIEDDLYVFVVNMNDMHFRAHGATPRLVGSDASTLADSNGKPIIREMVSLVKKKGQGELDYVWRNPVTKKMEDKHTYVRKVDNFLVGVGYYTR
jgi:cytochrome c